MIYIMQPDGTIMPSIPSPVYQGADGTNVIYLFAPSMVGNSVTVAFRTPDGVWTERKPMTQVAELPEEFSKYQYCVWKYTIDAPIARLSGVVTVQFFFYGNGAILPSSASSFVVGKGVPVILPQEPSQDVYDQILQALSAIQKSQQYGDYAARAIFEWRKSRVDGAAISYGIGEFTYVPAGAEGGPIGETGSFVKSLVAENTQPPYVEGKLNTEYWEEVVNFDYLYEQYFSDLQDLAKQAEGYKDAAETAQSGALSAKEAAEAAQKGALTAKEEAQAAQTQAELSKEQAGEYASQAGNSAQASARSAAEALSSATSAQEAAARAEEFAKYGIRINTEYSSVQDLPRPGNSQIIYFVPNGSSAPNAYDEYVWTDSGEYEKIGTTEIDLTAYLTKTSAAEIYETKKDAQAKFETTAIRTDTIVDVDWAAFSVRQFDGLFGENWQTRVNEYWCRGDSDSDTSGLIKALGFAGSYSICFQCWLAGYVIIRIADTDGKQVAYCYEVDHNQIVADQTYNLGSKFSRPVNSNGDTMGGPLTLPRVFIDTQEGSYNEGVRINAENESWAVVIFGTPIGTTQNGNYDNSMIVGRPANDTGLIISGTRYNLDDENRVRITQTGELYEKGQRVYSPNNPPALYYNMVRITADNLTLSYAFVSKDKDSSNPPGEYTNTFNSSTKWFPATGRHLTGNNVDIVVGVLPGEYSGGNYVHVFWVDHSTHNVTRNTLTSFGNVNVSVYSQKIL